MRAFKILQINDKFRYKCDTPDSNNADVTFEHRFGDICRIVSADHFLNLGHIAT